MTLSEIFQLPDPLLRKVKMAQNARATREIARQAMDCLDLTSLTGNEDDEDIFDLCDTAINNRLSSVCVYPPYVERASRSLKYSDIITATVINFPHGNKRTLSDEKATPETVKEDVTAAIKAGARQIDIVLAHEDFRVGNRPYPLSLLKACREECSDGVTMKVILETASFESSSALREACKMAIRQNADCLKTSTGKHAAGGAKLEHAAILFDEAKMSMRSVGVKISGGVKTVEQCAQYITLARAVMGWDCIKPAIFRIGGSTLLEPLLDKLKVKEAPEPAFL